MRARFVGGVGILVALLVAAGVASAQETVDGPIRVLFHVPEGLVVEAVQAERLERAISEKGGLLAVVDSIGEADVIVEIERYRLTTDAEGKPSRRASPKR